ncbi:MAG: CRISPR-associated endonuclease Cas1 [Rhodobacteraceae bacterium]|nr:CRISPR-associated endonuclease Cas1 [Paracoccaceae bacterium]
MPTLYVTEPGAVVRKQAGSLIITSGGGSPSHDNRARSPRTTLLEVEPHRLEMIGLVGRVNMTAGAMRMCLKSGIAVSWLTRGGALLGRLVPELSRTADLRLHQFRTIENTAYAMELGRCFIDAKLANATALLSALRSNRPGEPRLSQSIAHLGDLRERVSDATDRDTLMGLEGEGAACYFSVLGLAFSGDIKFSARRRRPPPDPANALLSLGYVLLTNFIAGILEARGFDPYLGVLHTPRSGRPSLALDLIEEFRHPVVDRFVLRLSNRRQFRPDCFETDPKTSGTRLKRDSLKKFFHEWEAMLDARMAGLSVDISVEQALQTQADRLANHIRGREPYRPRLLREAE